MNDTNDECQLHNKFRRFRIEAADLINYKNQNSRFMISLAASGAAAILRGDYKNNEILGISAISDGRFADDVYVPAGGTVKPISKEAIDNDLIYLDVPDPEGLMEKEAVRIVKDFPRMQPAFRGYRFVNMNYTVPINF